MLGLCERDVRNAFALANGLPVPNLTADTRRAPSAFAAMIDPGLTWDDVARLRSIAMLPILVKGIVRADDAEQAVEAGASGIVVSNRGGGNSTRLQPRSMSLGAITQAVRDRIDVLFDGGIRRGTDVVKALALGARAVQIGRPVLCGLTTDGQKGVATCSPSCSRSWISRWRSAAVDLCMR